MHRVPGVDLVWSRGYSWYCLLMSISTSSSGLFALENSNLVRKMTHEVELASLSQISHSYSLLQLLLLYPQTKSGILRIQAGHAAAEIFFGTLFLKNY